MHRWQFETMGTVASIVTSQSLDGELRRAVEQAVDALDTRFSLYQPESELSRVNAGELSLPSASNELRDMYALANDWMLATAGAFRAERPDGALDLNGVVKARAIAAAVQLLRESGIESGHVGIAGDGECWGSGPDDGVWRAGVVDPSDRQRIMTTVELGSGAWALATSGSAERGDHIWTRPGVTPPVQASVVAEDIVTADVLATAIVSGGVEFLSEATERWPIHAYVVLPSGERLATPGWSARRA